MWLADFDFQTSGWTFSVFLYPNESTESVTSRFPPKMGNSSTPIIKVIEHLFNMYPETRPVQSKNI